MRRLGLGLGIGSQKVGAGPDVTAPTIVSTSPDYNSLTVPATVSPTINFSENVVFGTGLITLRENNGGWSDAETFDVVTEVGTGNGQVSISGTTLTINPTASLTSAREYAIRIAATAIDDTTGNSFAGVADDATITFVVDDTTAPTLVSTSPTDNATGVADSVSPTLTFNENVAFGTGLITLRQNIASVWSDLETFDVETEVGIENGQVSIAGTTLTINPTSPLTGSREYAVRIDATAIDDLAGNSFAGIANDTTFSFTTAAVDVTAPTIVSTTPADNATGVSESISPSIIFSEAVAFGTGLITLRQNIAGTWSDLETFDVVTEVGTGNGQVSISGDVLTINPTTTLVFGREYAIRIAATAIDDLVGNSFAGIANDTSWSFTVLATPAATIDTLAYNAGTNEISLNTDTASGTLYYDLAATSTPMTGAAIEAGTMGTVAISTGVVTEVEDWTGTADGTYWLNVVQKVGAVYSNVLNLEVTVVTFNPAAIASHIFDASDLANLFQDTAGSTPVTTTADPVARANNIGTSGGTWLNTGATDRPIYTVSGATKYIQTDGSNDYLQWLGANGDVNIDGGFYMIFAIHENTANASKQLLSMSNTTASSQWTTHGATFDTGTTVGTGIQFYGGLNNANGIQLSDGTSAPIPLTIVEIEVIPAAGATNGWLRTRTVSDGDLVDRANDTATSGQWPNIATQTAQIVLGAGIGSGSPGGWAIERLYCFALVPGTISTDDRADFRLWAAEKVGW